MCKPAVSVGKCLRSTSSYALAEVGDIINSGAAPRDQLARLLAWEDAHVGFDTASAGIPRGARAKQPSGLPYSSWQLLEHLDVRNETSWSFTETRTIKSFIGPMITGLHLRLPPRRQRGTKASTSFGRTGRRFSNWPRIRGWTSPLGFLMAMGRRACENWSWRPITRRITLGSWSWFVDFQVFGSRPKAAASQWRGTVDTFRVAGFT